MTKILTARELHAWPVPGGRPVPLRSVAEYALAQERFLEASLNGARPYRATVVPKARIDGGNWLVSCACGNAPATDPEWRVAMCLHCGARFFRVEFPDDWRAFELVLMARPNAAWRHSTEPNGDGTRTCHDLSFLRAENAALGLPPEWTEPGPEAWPELTCAVRALALAGPVRGEET